MCQVLVVDDDPVHRYLVQYLCRSNSKISSLECFLKPADALDFITKRVCTKSLLPEVILFNVNMLALDSWKFFETLQNSYKSAEKQVSIFILSTAPQPKSEHLRMQYECVKGYFPKPLTKSILDRVIVS